MRNSCWLLSRRQWLGTLPGTLSALNTGGIDRRAMVERHNPVLRAFDPRSPLSVGNGELAFTADATGLQTFPELYEQAMPLCTQAQWGWHSYPAPHGLGEFRLTHYDTHGRKVGYATSGEGQKELYDWLRENPHRLHLGKIGLTIGNGAVRPEEVKSVEQTLDLWSGTLRSAFRIDDVPVEVETCCHPSMDLVAIRIRSSLLARGRLAVVFEFPYGSPGMAAADWNSPGKHRTSLTSPSPRRADLVRELDADSYRAAIAWDGPAALKPEAPHRFVLRTTSERLDFVCLFSPQSTAAALPSASATLEAARNHWARFWSEGGAIELSGSRDSRAKELERRIVLSQYQTAIQCAGSMPPQETGLTCNSWYGKFHLEMHWWHAAHFALWGRAALLERSLDWYGAILPSARRKARDQGYTGVRWPKMTGPDGQDSPSPIGPLLIWQQPHPIALAELCYQAHPNRATLERYRDLVFESAEFMASYAWFDAKTSRYVLGPPVIPAQENHPPRETWNPTFELEYWAQGLDIAQQWRRRLGLAPQPKWDEVRAKLAPLPVKGGVYLAHENCPQTFTERNRDHPSMLGALGVLRGSKVDRATMRRTLRKVFESWRWPDTWGWDYPMIAMTAARLGEPALAIDALMMETPKNTWLPNGHNPQRANLPLYLPGNGGLLAAIALMVNTPRGFPADWRVTAEGLKAWVK